MLKNSLLRWLLILNGIVLLAWCGVLGKRWLDGRRAAAESRAELRGIYARRGHLSNDDAAFLEGFGARSSRARTYSDADVTRLLGIFGRDAASPDDRFVDPKLSTRALFCIALLVDAKSYSETQQAMIAERLPPLPSTSKYPDLDTAVRLIKLMAKKFDNPSHRQRLQSAVDVALGKGRTAGRL